MIVSETLDMNNPIIREIIEKAKNNNLPDDWDRLPRYWEISGTAGASGHRHDALAGTIMYADWYQTDGVDGCCGSYGEGYIVSVGNYCWYSIPDDIISRVREEQSEKPCAKFEPEEDE